MRRSATAGDASRIGSDQKARGGSWRKNWAPTQTCIESSAEIRSGVDQCSSSRGCAAVSSSAESREPHMLQRFKQACHRGVEAETLLQLGDRSLDVGKGVDVGACSTQGWVAADACFGICTRAAVCMNTLPMSRAAHLPPAAPRRPQPSRSELPRAAPEAPCTRAAAAWPAPGPPAEPPGRAKAPP